MQRFRVPGVAIVLVDAGGPLLAVGYGYTDASKTVPIRDTTVFEAASLGKPLFAYSLLHHGAGPPFDLDRPVAAYLNAPPAAGPEAAVIDGRHLLSHSSGLVFSEAEDRRQVAFRPGSQWRYSGLGYSVLQQAAETLWSTSLEELVHETVTAPLGMEKTSFLPPQEGSVSLAPGHDRQGRRQEQTRWKSASAASSLHTCARDYGRFLSAMLAEIASGGEAAERMLDPQVEVEPELSLSWGLGWAIAQDAADTLFLHWGSNPGYKSLAVASVNQGVGMVVLTNGDNGLEVATALVPAVFGLDYGFLRFFMLHPDD